MDDLRDKFAIAAMQGLLSTGRVKDRESVASAAYEQADAMIAERESGSVDSVHSIKIELIEAIKEQHGMEIGELPLTGSHLVSILKSGNFLGWPI